MSMGLSDLDKSRKKREREREAERSGLRETIRGGMMKRNPMAESEPLETPL